MQRKRPEQRLPRRLLRSGARADDLARACLLALIVHVLRGWQLSGTGIRGLTALFYVPAYLVWKVVIMMGRKTSEWVRTEREVS